MPDARPTAATPGAAPLTDETLERYEQLLRAHELVNGPDRPFSTFGDQLDADEFRGEAPRIVGALLDEVRFLRSALGTAGVERDVAERDLDSALALAEERRADAERSLVLRGARVVGAARAHLRYLAYVLRHKWFVLVAGRRVRAPLWRLLIHDWSKVTPAEWGPYVAYFYGPKEPPPHVLRPENGRPNEGANRADWLRARREAFDRAWLHHQHANSHHWQHWVLREDSGALKLLDMPEHFVREMVADWMGAGRAITGRWEAAEWYEKNGGKMLLSGATQARVEALLGVRVRCHCGAFGSTGAACDAFGYCEAHLTPVSAQRPAGGAT